MTTEEQLAWERRRRPGAGVAAILAGLLPLISSALAGILLTGYPHGTALEGLAKVAADRPLDLRVRQVLYFDDRATELLLVAVLSALGAFGAAVALHLLSRATFRRQPADAPGRGFFSVGRVAAVVAPVVLGVGQLMSQVGTVTDASAFANRDERTLDGALDVLEGDFLVAGAFLSQLAMLFLGIALVIVSLAAMRVGLLTRFMGVLGILCGVLLGFTLGQVPPVVQYFWFILLGFLFLGRWPRGMPPAWATGRAEPWPSSTALREERLRAREEAQRTRDAGDDPAAGEGPSAPPRKKRKRRS